jgi:hypothetical protein
LLLLLPLLLLLLLLISSPILFTHDITAPSLPLF